MMRSILPNSRVLLFVLLFAGPGNAFAQDNTYRIIYDCTFSLKQAVKHADSGQVVLNGQPGAKFPVGFPEDYVLRQKIMTCIVEGTRAGSVIWNVFEAQSGLKSKSRSKIPDSLVYEKQVWESYKDDVIIRLPDSKADYVYTSESKNILGYTCNKVMITYLKEKTTAEAWITPELPATLVRWAVSRY
jgi:GLPGLI family protein